MKFYGVIGYVKTEETTPGVWMPVTVEKEVLGDYIRSSHRFNNAGQVNDDVSLVTSISIIADPYVLENFEYIKYVKRSKEGTAWKVETIDDSQYPRLVLTLGGRYNAQ